MVRIPTAWTNSQTDNSSVSVGYSDPAILYSSPNATYSYSSPYSYDSPVATYDSSVLMYNFPSTSIKPFTGWTLATKPKNIWSINQASEANEYPYDSNVYVYDSLQTYDGIVPGQSPVINKPLTGWTQIV